MHKAQREAEQQGIKQDWSQRSFHLSQKMHPLGFKEKVL